MDLSAISNHKGGPPRSIESNQPNLRLHVMLLEMPNSALSKEEFSTIDFLWLRRVIVGQRPIHSDLLISS